MHTIGKGTRQNTKSMYSLICVRLVCCSSALSIQQPLQVTQQAPRSKTATMSSEQKPLRGDHQLETTERKPVERRTTEHKPVERRPLEHKSTGANHQPSVEPVEGFEECKSSLTAILNNQPIPVTGTNTNVRATIAATTTSQRKPLYVFFCVTVCSVVNWYFSRILGYHKMPWDGSPTFLARHSVYVRKKVCSVCVCHCV